MSCVREICWSGQGRQGIWRRSEFGVANVNLGHYRGGPVDRGMNFAKDV